MASAPTRILYIVYNADSTVLGKLRYGYGKLSSDKKSACAACDLTHGGLSLSETKAWKQAKEDIAARDPQLKLVQWHRDEMSPQLKDFIKSTGTRYPAAILEEAGTGEFTLTVSESELTSLKGNAEDFVKMLNDKGIIPGKSQASL